MAAATAPKSDPFSRWITLLSVAAIGVYLFHVVYIEIEFRLGRWPRGCPLGSLLDVSGW
jgi:hypothetical protein